MPAHLPRTLATAFAALALCGCSGSPNPVPPTGEAGAGRAYSRQDPFVARPFAPFIGRRWIGNAIAYGPHRDGQRPGGPSPSREELRQDLKLMLDHWRLLRVYGSAGPADSMLDIIHRDRLDMRVLLGIWVQAEDRRDSGGVVLERFPDAVVANRREVEAGIRLAAAHPGIVLGLCVGNETQVFWSANRVAPERLIGLVREVRARTRVPVTVADDFNFWNKPESRAVGREVDFLCMNAHPAWNGQQLDGALAWTQKTLEEVQAMHPGQPVVIGETGWPTLRIDAGDQGRLIQGKLGEPEQAAYFRATTEWALARRVPTFFFEAFDENWKGGDAPGDVEKHWGLFRADRTPKRALAGGP